MNSELKDALAAQLLAMADDELLLAHRNAEWIGHAPILEEDIALANIAQDELGHAMVWYQLHQDLTGLDSDRIVYFRDAAAFRNVQLVEWPKGDWAFTMVRQFLFDAYELALFTRLASSSYAPLSDAVAKIKNEEVYHYRHSSTWVERLGLGTEESHSRMQQALDLLWPLASQLFESELSQQLLVELEMFPDLTEVKESWKSVVIPHFAKARLDVPEEATMINVSRKIHTDHLDDLLTDLQQVAREDPEAVW
ncbi:MAG: 1,2-phenylacetyl-CoA epoxidase subunit PaaC [Chloroflexota bacterium]